MSKQDPHKPLNIYRASAGSGKTHLLTGFYIKLLFLSELLPETHSGEMHFNEVLAVTFTNKATAEMKSRIIEELHLLSQTPRKSHYWDEISHQGERPEQQIRDKATELLVQILNEYSSFNISTIDSFFQKIVRSFARELNVPGNYEVELDSKSVVEASVASFLDKLDPRHDRSLFDWMLRFSDQRSEKGEGWDFRANLLELADKVLGSEQYRRHSKQIKDFTSDKQQLEQYEKMLRNIVSDWRRQLVSIGEQGQELLTRYAIDKKELSNGGSGTTSVFPTWAKGIEKNPSEGTWFNKILESPDKLFKPESGRVGSELQHQLVGLMQAGMELFQGDTYTNYVTATFIQQDFYELGIIANIDEELRTYCNDHNKMLLSSVTELLAKLIGPYDAPFVYEKTGSHLKSYMIDEFQDTSGLQWHNFMPLVSNALSQGYQNLIVGDVKQSIYRWRGSDWGLLDSEISHYEPQRHNDNDEELRTNWRSLPAIVEWNNRFFTAIARQLDAMAGTQQIQRIYKDVCQALPADKTRQGAPTGMVSVQHLIPLGEDGEPLASPTKDDLVREARRQLPLQVIRLQQQGFEPSDIAILCRRKEECRQMAEALLQYRQEHPECPYPMDIISDEALQLGARPVIQTLISMMQLLQCPESELQQAITWSNYLQLEGLSTDQALQRYFQLTPEQRTLLPQMAFRPLYELTELLIDRLPQSVVHEEAAFLQAFRDVVLEYCHSHNADLSAFLEWWELSGYKKAIATPDAMNAIQIMTIHKLKGLGMPAVIIPYASWEMDISTTHEQIIWCEPTSGPFKRDILLPIKLDKRLTDTIFCQDFAEERLRSIIDNLNTAYVAFTRPKEAMVILCPEPKEKGTSMLEYLLTDYCTHLPDSGEYCISGELSIPLSVAPHQFEIGESGIRNEDLGIYNVPPATDPQHKLDSSLLIPQSSFSEAPDSSFLNPNSSLEGAGAGNAPQPLPALSIMHSPLQQDSEARRRGNCIHRALQEIRYAHEATQRVHELFGKGIIDARIITEAEMLQAIHRLLAIPEVAAWFDDSLQVLNEQTLMNRQGQQIRPDRIILDAQGQAIVIDYKTGSDHRGYRKQVHDYMRALRDLGFRRVRGYLFFLKDEKIVEVR